jgi:hypothetical protein
VDAPEKKWVRTYTYESLISDYKAIVVNPLLTLGYEPLDTYKVIFKYENYDGRQLHCLGCVEDIEEGDPIIVDRTRALSSDKMYVHVAYWHEACFNAESD